MTTAQPSFKVREWCSSLLRHATSWPVTLIFICLTIYLFRAALVKDKQYPTPGAALTDVLATDKPLGTHVNAGLPNLGSSYIVICARLCSCDVDQLAVISNRPGTKLPVRIVVEAKPSALTTLPQLQPFTRLFVFDPDMQIASQLNAQFMPRCYVMSERNEILWKSDYLDVSWLSLISAAEASMQTRSTQ